MKIPHNAKKVFTGVLFDVYQWQQKVYDGSTQTFEMLERKPSVDVIATVGDTIMVLMQEQPTKPLFPSLPGGQIEKAETPLAAAKRELLEETGYASSSITLLQKAHGTSKLHFPEHLFLARNCKKIKEPELDGGEKITVTFMNFEGFLQLCRNERFTAPLDLKLLMYESLLDQKKKASLKEKIFD